MNKLGFYIQTTMVPGLADAIRDVKPPTLLVHADDRGLLQEIRRGLSPDTFIVGRLHMTPSVQDEWLRTDPEGQARALADRVLGLDGMATERGANGRLLIDAWMSLNECVPGPASDEFRKNRDAVLAKAAAYDRFQVTFRQRLKERDPALEAVAFNFGAGNFPQPTAYLNWFPRTLQSYTYLGFHEYGWPALADHLRPGVSSCAGTYRRVMKGIREKYGDHHRAIITEAGLARLYRHVEFPPGDVGWQYRDGRYPDETVTPDDYWRSLVWYNKWLCQDAYVLGACLFSVGPSGDWASFGLLWGQDGSPLPFMSQIRGLGESVPPDIPPDVTGTGGSSTGSGTGTSGTGTSGTGSSGTTPSTAITDPNVRAFLDKGLITLEGQGTAFKLQDVIWTDPAHSGGMCQIFLDLIDAGGRRIVGGHLRVSWPGGSTLVVIEEKPGELWGGSFPMPAPLGAYTVEVEEGGGTSDRLAGLGTGTLEDPRGGATTWFGVRFRAA